MKKIENISVLIATRDRPKLLEKCLRSITNQTLLPNEVVIVDTSSSPKKGVVGMFEKDLHILYAGRPGLNAPAARNACIQLASNEIVIFIDDDCVAEERWLEKMLSLFRENPEATIISGRVIQSPSKSLYGLLVNAIRSYRRNIADSDKTNYISIDNCIFNKKKLGENNIVFDETLSREEDIDIALQVLQKGGKIILGNSGLVHHHSRQTLWGFLLQRFQNSGNNLKLSRKWNKQPFYFYGSKRASYVKPLFYILQNLYRRKKFIAMGKFIALVILSVLFYEAGYLNNLVAYQLKLKYSKAKYLIDSFVALMLFIVAAPALLFIGLLIKLDSPGPILIILMRVGKDRKLFRLYKFRTMWVDAKKRYPQYFTYAYTKKEIETKGIKSHEDPIRDPRVTRIGRFLRRTSLDELPNLFNIIRGEMGFIGPRPEIPQMLKYYKKYQLQRFSIRPGLTGYSQINGRGLLTFQETIALDLRYIKERSVLVNIKVLIKTFWIIMNAKGAF